MMSALKIVSTLLLFNFNVPQISLPFEGVLRLDKKYVMSICPSRNNIHSIFLAGGAWLYFFLISVQQSLGGVRGRRRE
jgi:hypothetical protein